MFAIKREQRQKMGEPAFIDRTAEHMREYHIEHVYDLEDDELRFRVRHGVRKARSYGLTWESSLTIFISHMLTIHPAFDEQPAINAVLVDPEIPGDEKMHALMGLVEDEDWEQALNQGNPAEYWDRVHKEPEQSGAHKGEA